MRFRQPDKSLLRLTLGPVDLSSEEGTGEPEIGKPLTLAAARRLAADVNRKRAMGHDFRAAKQRQKFEREDKSAKTFEWAATDFVKQHSMRKVRGWKLQARSLGLRPRRDGAAGLELIPGGLAERWRTRPLSEIDGDDVHALVREVKERGVPGLGRKNLGPSDPRARAVFSDLSKFFAWCVGDRRLKISPVVGVTKPRPPASRDRVLRDHEIALVWKSCDRIAEPFGACVRLMLLTATRRNEVSGMRRSEVAHEISPVTLLPDGKVWRIPEVRVKNHRPHLVPLSPLAQEILADVDTTVDLVFTTNGTTQISGWSKTKKKLDEEMLKLAREQALAAGRSPDEVQITPWTLHDLKRTAGTGLASIGVPPHIVEAVLNHVSGFRSGVAGTYNLYAYFPEKKDALERWAAHIAGLISDQPASAAPLQPAEA